MKNGLHRHYGRLGPEKRFGLDILAMARGDMVESERLVNTCPKLPYKMNDRAFAGRWSGARELALRTYILLEKSLSKLETVDALREIFPYLQAPSRNVATESYFIGHHLGSIQAWGEAGHAGRPPAWPAPEAAKPEGADEEPAIVRDMERLDRKLENHGGLLPEIMDRWERELARTALGVWAGFSRFCAQSMGVAAEKVLCVTLMKPLGSEAVERVEGLKARAERLDLKPDAEIIAALEEGLRESWQAVEAWRV